ncbi:hypothetical protein GC096_11355 [Paenibacillus sp. LMG 31461]|uniref:DUF4162 domain-containing protein n=1 Tax=Paenibacillus plantarum TaxID=2654975 RepID=A0ABX1X866_9BACL|nr:hypothetical protein [Paenibacillus plantarum]NOU64627.1 hypothetical protein [Paenibacillus plantarum]
MCDRVAILQQGKLVDVKPIGHFTQDSEQTPTYRIEAQPIEEALDVLGQMEGIQRIKLLDEALIEVTTERERVPDMLDGLMQHHIRIYGVQVVRLSLEDRFLEITGTGRKQIG